MSEDSNLGEKISDSILSIFTKTKIFEKIDKLNFYVKYFVLLSTVYLTGSMTCHYIAFKNKNKINKDFNSELNYIKENRIKMLYDNIVIMHNKIDNLEFKLTNLIEKQQHTLNEIYKLPLLNIGTKNTISQSTSISSLSSESFKDPIIENESEIKNVEGEYYEILNECYDIIPLNNIKKFTGLKKWLF